MSIYLHELLEGWVDDAPEIRLAGISLDTQAIEAGAAFVAVKSHAGHGLDDARAAVDAGAVAVIHDGLRTPPPLDVPVVKIHDLGRKLGELASRYYAAPSELMTIAGVTGSNGKTSIAHYLAQSWQRVYGGAGVVGTLGDGPVGVFQSGKQTTPDAIRLQQVLADCVGSGIEHLAMEVSSSALKQKHLETVQFNAAIFTDLVNDQPCSHKDRPGAAQRLLFTDYAPLFAVMNHDDVHGRRWFRELNGGMQMLSFGLEKGAELSAEIHNMYSGGTTFRINGPWGSERIHTNLPGKTNLSFLLATAATLALLGMPWHRVLHQLEVMEPLTGRARRSCRNCGQAAFVTDYTRTPDALEVAA